MLLSDLFYPNGDMSVRLYYCLTKAGCKTLEDALAATPNELRRKAPFGSLCIKELAELAAKYELA